MARVPIHPIYSFVFALLLCTTVVGATSQLASFNNMPPPAAEIQPASGSHDQLLPLW